MIFSPECVSFRIYIKIRQIRFSDRIIPLIYITFPGLKKAAVLNTRQLQSDT